jgi:phosphoribosylformylglycinamidine (FGAM) synthase-like enzyme
LIHKFSVRPAAGTVSPDLEQARHLLGLPDLDIWCDYYIEVEDELAPEQVEAVCAALTDGVGTVVVHGEPLDQGIMVQVAHRSGIIDNESDSIVAICEFLGVRARAGKVALTYRSTSPTLTEVIGATRYNPNIEELHTREPAYRTLVPGGRYIPAETYDLLALDGCKLEALGRAGGRNLSPRQMRQIRAIQAATGAAAVTDVLLEALDARWSDHCFHITWRSHGNLLGRLVQAARDTGNPNIVSMFEDNAGVWDFYDGWALAVKGETHNGPSALSAYFGQLTKLGGVLRDILGTGLGADPIGCLEYTATGFPESPSPIAGRPAPRQIAGDTIRAIKEYGNTFGVPMMWSHMTFHPAYRAKPFALGASVGLLPRDLACRGRPRPGDLVVLIGGLTGNEGIHGASASSAGATMDEAAVQIGAPLEQVKFRKAIIDLRNAGCLRALTDVGGAGLNSAVGEIGEACGVWINTALVPLKTSALPMWRILLSESQERMVLAVPPGKLEATRAITARHLVRTTVIGRFTGIERYCVFHAPALDEASVVVMPPDVQPDQLGELGFDVPYGLLHHEPEQRPVRPPPTPDQEFARWPELDREDLSLLLRQVVADPEVASQRYADDQYDSTVQGNTAHGPSYGRRHRVPSHYWAATPLDGSPAAVVVSTAFDPWLFDAHPVRALRQMFCRLLGAQVLAGVALGDMCVCDNFYTPHLEPDAAEWLVAMVDELARLVRLFGTPVISGKDSSAGSTQTDEGLVSVPPAVFLTALGKVPSVDRLLSEQWRRPGGVLVRIGPETPSVTATVVARARGMEGGALDYLSAEDYRDYLGAVAEARHLFRSGAPIGPGGLATRLVAGALAGHLGVDLAIEPDAETLFAEHRCGAVVEVDEDHVAGLPDALRPLVIGRLREERGIGLSGKELLTPDVEEAWASSFSARIA